MSVIVAGEDWPPGRRFSQQDLNLPPDILLLVGREKRCTSSILGPNYSSTINKDKLRHLHPRSGILLRVFSYRLEGVVADRETRFESTHESSQIHGRHFLDRGAQYL